MKKNIAYVEKKKEINNLRERVCFLEDVFLANILDGDLTLYDRDEHHYLLVKLQKLYAEIENIPMYVD